MTRRKPRAGIDVGGEGRGIRYDREDLGISFSIREINNRTTPRIV